MNCFFYCLLKNISACMHENMCSCRKRLSNVNCSLLHCEFPHCPSIYIHLSISAASDTIPGRSSVVCVGHLPVASVSTESKTLVSEIRSLVLQPVPIGQLVVPSPLTAVWRHNILASEWGHLTAFHSVLFFIFLFYGNVSFVHDIFNRHNMWLWIEKIVCDVSSLCFHCFISLPVQQ